MSESNDQNKATNETTQGCGCCGQEKDSAKEEAKQAYQEAGKAYEHLFPKVTFSTFILSLSSSAMVHLGEVPEPETGQTSQNLPLAKHTIDILAMLKEKTCKCLDPEEAKMLDGLLYELRMTYVVKSK